MSNDRLRVAFEQYLEGAITFAEFVLILAEHYDEAQRNHSDTCASCGGDLSNRLR